MKKSTLSLLSLLLSSLCLAIFAACEPVNDPENPQKPENPEEGSGAREEVSVSTEDFSISIRNITESSAVYDLDPEDDQMLYVHFLEVQRELEGNHIVTDDDIFAYDMGYFENMAHAKGITLADAVAGYAKTGHLKDLPLQPLVSNTEYVMYAYGVQIEGEEVKRVTDVTRCPFLTFSVEKEKVAFDLRYVIHGPVVEMYVDPGKYTGYYYFDYVEGSYFDEDVEFIANEVWNRIYDMLTHLGYTPDDILLEGCSSGKDHLAWELNADTEYTGFAFALNEEAQVSSYVVQSAFRTEKVGMSENVISISVDQLSDRTADVYFTPSLMESYTELVFRASDLEGMSDEDILSYCAYDLVPPTFTGERVERMDRLEPETEYVAVAFGFWGGVVTTGLFRKDFKTTEAQSGTYSIRADFGAYYDILEISKIDPKWVGKDQIMNAVLPVEIITEPADADKYYFGVYMLYEDSPLTAEVAKNVLLGQGYKKVKKDVYWLLYDVKYRAAAMIEDADGHLSEVWFSEDFTLKRDGAGDPQVFVDSEYNGFDFTSHS